MADAASRERGCAVPTQFPISKVFRHGDILGLGELQLGQDSSGKSQQHPLPEHRHVPGAGEVQGHWEWGKAEVEIFSESWRPL